jgi:hypothetical protein
MMRRCYDQSDSHYPRWGGRGIRVCDRWQDVRLFIEDIERELGDRPAGLSLDRWPDNDGDYRPGNVRWADPLGQWQNSRLHNDELTGRFTL